MDRLAKISAIQSCPRLKEDGLIFENRLAFKKIASEFYNPAVHQTLTCLVQTVLNNMDTSQIQLDANVNTLQANDPCLDQLIAAMKRLFGNDNDYLQYIAIRTVDRTPGALLQARQKEDIINEAFVGTVYLNLLRASTSNFKYVYGIYMCDDMPYLIEEALTDALPLSIVIESLPPTEQGVRALKSIVIQLLLAIQYAADAGVTNLPIDIVVRKVDPDTTVLAQLDGIKYVSTYGWVPVYQRYQTASVVLDRGSLSGIISDEIVEIFSGIPEATSQARDRLLDYILDQVNELNPVLAEMVELDAFSTDLFDGVVQDCPGKALTCKLNNSSQSCPSLLEIIRFFQVPLARVDAYVRSGVERMDELRALLAVANENIDPESAFIIMAVLIKYAQLLNNVAESVDENVRDRLFLEERYYPAAVSDERYLDIDANIVRPDLEFVRDQLKLSLSSTTQIIMVDQETGESFTETYELSRTYLRDAIRTAVERGRQLQQGQRRLLPIDLTTIEGVENAVANLILLIANTNYFETTNALIDAYRTYIGVYNEDLKDALQETRFLKENYDILFIENPNSLEQVLSKEQDVDTDVTPEITNMDDAILALLYATFVGKLSDPLNRSLQRYLDLLSDEEINEINDEVRRQRLVASDPVPLIVPEEIAI